ncbi:MAG: ATP-binding protein [Desulfobacterales bacterium]|nr:ATP-binding protein [Desulfobacterales bacterium]
MPPWIFIGAVLILLPIFAYLIYENIHRQKEHSTRLLLEKGAALIRSFEAGTRTGMMGMGGTDFRLQRLLSETAQQPDIEYLMVTDANGRILAHDEQGSIGSVYGKELNLQEISRSQDLHWRIVTHPEGKKIFEVFRRFASTGGGMMGMRMGRMMFGRPFGSERDIGENPEPSLQVIFIGLDMTPIEQARLADSRHSIIMGITLLLVGFAGIFLLFLTQSYRAAKASLSRIKAFSDNLVDNMPIGLLATDTFQKVVAMNYVAGRILELSVPDSIGKGAEQILPKELLQQFQSLNVSGGVVEQEINCTLKNGAVLHLEANATLLKDETGNLLGSVLLFKDLSEVRALRKEIARNQRLATVGRLAAGVAHEIRNPLSSIKGFATYFKERYQDAPEDLHIANIMIQEVDRLNRVVGQLLEFARPVTISKRPLNLKTFVADSLKLVERQAAEKTIRIRTNLADFAETVLVDPDKMNQVLLNLYLNAIESMDEGGGSLSVTLAADNPARQVAIRIADTGSGIREQDLGHIFDPYFTTKAAGTGLGLAIAQKIIEGHGGAIKIDSNPRGTTVTIFLPFTAGTESHDSA